MTSNPRSALLRLRAVAAGYGAMSVVHNVDLDVDEGESVGIHGPNGAGKTTLLNTIAGAQRTHSGTIELDGRRLDNQPAHKRVAAGLALVPAGRQIITSLSSRANLDITLLSRGRARRDDEHHRRLGKVLEVFPMLEVCMDRPGGLLSGGQQQMLAVARALMTAPRVLLLDEPTQGLAEIIVDDLVRVLNELRRQGMALVVVEQRGDFLEAVTDRMLPLRMGRLGMPSQS